MSVLQWSYIAWAVVWLGVGVAFILSIWRIRNVEMTRQIRRVVRLQTGIAFNAVANAIFAVAFSLDGAARAFVSVGWALAAIAAIISIGGAFAHIYVTDEIFLRRVMFVSLAAFAALVAVQVAAAI